MPEPANIHIGAPKKILPRKVLIVKLGAIGDVATVLPAAWQLHQSGAEIHWLCGKSVAPLLSCYSWVRPIIVDDSRLLGPNRLNSLSELLRTWRKLIGTTYDLAATLQYDRRYRLLTLPVIARRTISLHRDRRATSLISERHHTAEYARILCNLPDDYRPVNFAPVAPDHLPANPLPTTGCIRIALVPGGARNLIREDAQRRWPTESYVQLAQLLLQRGHEVILSGGPTDTWAGSHFAGVPIDNRIGQWTIPQTLAFYQSCDCVVTHDTGPLHLAGLTQCGLVALFGPTPPSKFLPRRNGVVALWGGERLPCRPCYDGRDYAACTWNGCMVSIAPQLVAATVDRVLAGRNVDWRIESV